MDGDLITFSSTVGDKRLNANVGGFSVGELWTLTHEHINDWVAVALFLILPVITNE
jgi:hypothetical protein